MDTRRGAEARAAPDATEELQPDQAVFSVEPLGRTKRRFPVVAAAGLGIGVVVAGIVGTIGQPPPPKIAELPVATAAAIASSPGEMTSLRFAEGPFGPFDGRTGVVAGPAGSLLLTVDANRSDALLFVHGDVFTRRAVVVQVLVTISEGRNRTLVIESVDMPGGSTAFRLGANDRFDLAVDVPDSPSMQPTTVTANALDAAGAIVATAKTQLGQFAIEAPVAYR